MSKSRILRAFARTVCPLLVFALGVSALAPRAFAQANGLPPERMAYQGYVVDANGIPLATNAPKNYDVIFRIWNDSSATAAGNRLWTEQQTVTVDKGYFSVILGEGSSIGEARPALSTVFTNSTASDRWIALTVKGIGPSGTDANILPRLRLISSPYAFLATKATSMDGAGLTTGTVPDARLSSNVALRSGGNTFSGNQIINNNLGLGTGTPNFPLSFPDSVGEKISLWGQVPGNTFGLGIQNNLLQIHGATSANDIAFGYGHSTNLTETMRISGGGRLQVNGGIFARGGAPGANGALNNGYAFSGNNGDTDSGMFSPADGALTFYVNGTEKVRLDSNGNMGLGTNSPQARLHVSGGNVQLESNSQLIFTDNGEIRSADPNHRILFRRSENKIELREFGDIIFSPGAGSGTETAKAVILASGNMGIGTTNPAAKLHVAGAGNFLGSTPYIKFSDVKAKGSNGGASIGNGINDSSRSSLVVPGLSPVFRRM